MNTDKILIVDDEKDIRDIVGIYLENNGYEVIKAESGVQALDLMQKNSIELCIVDVMMPDMDGVTLCMKIRNEYNTPIIMLSAKSQDMDKVIGLSAGADDYLAKPFNPVELLARVRAQLRRYHELNPSNSVSQVLTYGELKLDLEAYKVLKNGVEIRLTLTEFQILELLWKNQGIVFSMDRIYNRIWSEEDFEIDSTVMVHIGNLRKKLEETKENPKYIKTVWGIGYKFGD